MVEDDQGVRNILTALLTASGYRVLKASSGSEALTVYHAHSSEIALVLTDVMMADGDGFSLVADLRNENVTVPLMMMSGLGGSGQYEDQAKHYGVRLLAKPISREVLIGAVNSALATRAA